MVRCELRAAHWVGYRFLFSKELSMNLNKKAVTTLLLLSLLLPLTALRAQAAPPITVETFVRAESDTAIRGLYNRAGGLGKFGHLRTPTPLDNQPIIANVLSAPRAVCSCS